MSRVVRSSKFRHVFGTVKKEQCFDDVRVTRNAWDTDLATANPKYVAVIYEAQGGGSFAVMPWGSAGGKVDPKLALVSGHKGTVLDLDWNPFNDDLIVSASEDCTAKIWGIPSGGLTKTMDTPLQTLNGHKRKVGTVKFNPVANNILATTSTDLSVKVWDIEKGDCTFSVDAQHSDIITSCDWSSNGALLATACKDKKLRVIDVRGNKIVQEVEAHGGIKGSRCIWLGKDRLLSVGFTKSSERDFSIWDPRNLSAKLSNVIVDSASGMLMPFWDGDVNMLYLAGKGDGNIRYYEVVDEAPYVYYLSEFKSNTPQRGACLVPKRALNVSEVEIARIVKVGTSKLEPICFQVPRKSDIFQDDIYPDTYAGEPSISANEWCAGKDAEPKTRSLAPGFTAKEKVVEFNPTQKQETKLSEDDLKKEVDRLTNRVAFLEAELIKGDAKIKDLQS